MLDNNLAPRSILPEVAADATVRTVTFSNFRKFIEFSHDRRVISAVVRRIGRIDRLPSCAKRRKKMEKGICKDRSILLHIKYGFKQP